MVENSRREGGVLLGHKGLAHKEMIGILRKAGAGQIVELYAVHVRNNLYFILTSLSRVQS